VSIVKVRGSTSLQIFALSPLLSPPVACSRALDSVLGFLFFNPSAVVLEHFRLRPMAGSHSVETRRHMTSRASTEAFRPDSTALRSFLDPIPGLIPFMRACCLHAVAIVFAWAISTQSFRPQLIWQSVVSAHAVPARARLLITFQKIFLLFFSKRPRGPAATGNMAFRVQK